MEDSSALPLQSDDAPDASAAWRTTPLASPVGTSTSAALRCWLQAQRRADADGGIDPTEVRRTMRQLAGAGRQRSVPVERLIMLLKELWATLPPDPDGDGRMAARGVGSRAVLDGIIRMCIEEFYATAPERSR